MSGGWGRLRASCSAWLVFAILLVPALVRLPFLGAPLSPDEGGFLLVGGQWLSGHGSLYGGYWVDRPPLLIAIFAVADAFGGRVPLRLIGILAATVTVFLASRIGRSVSGATGALWCAVAAAAFVSMPRFDARQVSGELLSVPFVMAGVLCVLAASSATGRRATWLLTGAGACGSSAFLVKQSFVDVFVFVLVFAVISRLQGGTSLLRTLVPVGFGALGVLVVAVGGAALVGTSPVDLWHAVVTFRADASRVIAAHADENTTERLRRYPEALWETGVFALGLVLVLRGLWAVRTGRRRPDPLVVGTVALVAWASFAALAGGSYWMHYLLGLVPALTMASALVVRQRDVVSGLGRVALVWALGVTLVTSAQALSSRDDPVGGSTAAGRWLAARAQPGDTAMTAYGQPNILAESGTSSPYPDLWSLPVRVRDAHLSRFTAVLAGPTAPDWLLVYGTLESWGVDPARAQVVLERDYRPVGSVCGWVVYLHDGVVRDVPGSLADSCPT